VYKVSAEAVDTENHNDPFFAARIIHKLFPVFLDQASVNQGIRICSADCTTNHVRQMKRNANKEFGMARSYLGIIWGLHRCYLSLASMEHVALQ
jgi:hypothetical protein